MLRLPEAVSDEAVADATAAVAGKRTLPALARVRIESLDEGRCAQILHVGPYAEEAPTIELLHAFVAREGLRPCGPHHEIYLGDPRRAAPEKLRTILRVRVARVAAAGAPQPATGGRQAPVR